MTRSKHESPGPRGHATERSRRPERGAEAPDDADDRAGRTGRLEVGLEHMRYRHLAWMAFGLVVGALLVWKLGTVGRWVGVVLMVVGAVATYSFVRTLLYPAGTITVGDDGAGLPRGLCARDPARLPIADVKHAYLLRRSVPWTRAAPVLVIEAGGRAFTYPRDWFLTEADQRRIVRELQARGVGGGAPDVDADDAPARGA